MRNIRCMITKLKPDIKAHNFPRDSMEHIQFKKGNLKMYLYI